MRDHINFPMEIPAIVHTITKTIAEKHENPFDYSMDEESFFDHLASETEAKLWAKFLSFGTASAGVIGILLIIQGFKLLVDTIIRGYTLHPIYGWSAHLLGAILSSLTSLLMHLGTPNTDQPAHAPPEVEMRDISYQQMPIIIETKPESSGEYPNISQVPNQTQQRPCLGLK